MVIFGLSVWHSLQTNFTIEVEKPKGATDDQHCMWVASYEPSLVAFDGNRSIHLPWKPSLKLSTPSASRALLSVRALMSCCLAISSTSAVASGPSASTSERKPL